MRLPSRLTWQLVADTPRPPARCATLFLIASVAAVPVLLHRNASAVKDTPPVRSPASTPITVSDALPAATASLTAGLLVFVGTITAGSLTDLAGSAASAPGPTIVSVPVVTDTSPYAKPT